MDVYVLDTLLRRTIIFDRFDSMIWTERFSSHGDFEWVIKSTQYTRNSLVIGSLLAIRDSNRMMIIETIETKTDSTTKRKTMSISGRSWEAILLDRVARANMLSLATAPKWLLTFSPGDVARTIFNTVCVMGALNEGDKIPFYVAGSLYPPDTIAEDTDVDTYEIPLTTVYDAIKAMCDGADLGFRLTRNGDTSQTMFNIYAGNDHTSAQSLLPVIVFSEALGNLTNVNELVSTANLKNVCLVFAKNGSMTVYAPGTNPTVSGLNRRVMVIQIDSELAAGGALNLEMQNQGLTALAAQKNIVAFDGEIPKNTQYKYDRDYSLGDLVEMRNTDGITNYMRVTEQIFVSDVEGEKSYPTLAIDLIITPGSWFALSPTLTWSAATGTWAEA